MSASENLSYLQNGSDIRGVAIDGVSGEPITLSPELVNRIAAAFVVWLAQKLQKPTQELRIGVGHDSRLSAEQLKQQALQGIASTGAQPFDCGLASTPAMYMATQFSQTKYDGSIMITASHLPYNRNGLKFFDADGGAEKKDISWILSQAAQLPVKAVQAFTAPTFDLISLYAANLREKIQQAVSFAEDYQHPLKNLHVVVDAGNGSGGFFVDQVLQPLGAKTQGSQFLEPDGNFPNHIPNPENKQAMEAIQKATVVNGADLGIIFDTDVDRMSAVLSDGTEVNRDAIIALMSAIVAKDYPGSTIITDSVTSDRLTCFLEEKLGLTHHRYMRGYKNVINECKRLNNQGIVAPLAIETSGHGALSENYYLDDGAYLAVKLLIAAAQAKQTQKKLDDLIAEFPKGMDCREYRMKIGRPDFKEYGQHILELFQQRATEKGYHVVPNSYEGVRLSFNCPEVQGWVLLRMSLHDPLMPLNLEGNRPNDCDRLLEMIRSLLHDCYDLDLSVLG